MAKKFNVHNLCRDMDNNIVLRVAHYFPKKSCLVVSVYGYVGIRSKRMKMLKRAQLSINDHVHSDTIKENMAQLWAMENDVSNYVIQYGGPVPFGLQHPTEPTQENQP